MIQKLFSIAVFGTWVRFPIFHADPPPVSEEAVSIKAKNLGQMAFVTGLECTPAFDPAVCALIKQHPTLRNQICLKWYDGYAGFTAKNKS